QDAKTPRDRSFSWRIGDLATWRLGVQSGRSPALLQAHLPMLVAFVDVRLRAGRVRLRRLEQVADFLEALVIPILALLRRDEDERDLRVVLPLGKPRLERLLPQLVDFRAVAQEARAAGQRKVEIAVLLADDGDVRIEHDLLDLPALHLGEEPDARIGID